MNENLEAEKMARRSPRLILLTPSSPIPTPAMRL